MVKGASGRERPVSGLFGALSFDEGETWDVRKAIAPDDEREVESFDGRRMRIGPGRAEPRGYLSVCQTPDGVIHLISSRLHYAFNLKWLLTPPPAAPPPPGAEGGPAPPPARVVSPVGGRARAPARPTRSSPTSPTTSPGHTKPPNTEGL